MAICVFNFKAVSLPAGRCGADFFGEGFLTKSIINRRFADTLSRREKRSVEVPT